MSKNHMHINRSKMPTTGKHIQLNISEPNMVILDNGIETYIIDEGEVDFTRLDFVFNAGSAIQNKGLIAESTIQLLADGTNTMSSEDIAKKLDFHGAIIDTNLTKDKASLTLYSLNKQLPKLLPILKDMLENASFEEYELSNYINRKRHQFSLNIDKVKFKAMLEFNKLIFGSDSSYGRVKELSDYDAVLRQDLVSFYNSQYTPQNTYIIASGSVKSDTISNINKYFGTNQGKPVIGSINKFQVVDVTSINKFIKKEGSLQSAIRIGKPVIGKQHQDYNSLIVLNTILGGYFGSRLMSNLREQKGFTYGVNSYIMNYQHGNYWSIATEVNADHTDEAIDEIRFEINRLMNEKVSNTELDIVKNYIYGTYLRSFDGPLAKAERFRSAKDLDLNFEHYVSSLDEMMTQTPKQLHTIANEYCNYEKMIVLVVGKTKNDNIAI